MIKLLISIIVVTLLISILAKKSRNRDRVSDSWLKNHSEDKDGEDGVCWKWPIDKIMNESALFNSYVEKRRKKTI